jgi:hypothetical protein
LYNFKGIYFFSLQKTKRMNSKMLIGGVLGGITLFLLGWLIYGVIFADSMAGQACMRAKDDLNIPMIAVGNIISGLLLGYIFSKWASISTFMGGAIGGAVIGLLMAAGFDCLMYGTTTMVDGMKGILIDVVISTIMYAIAGGVVGWWMGRK